MRRRIKRRRKLKNKHLHQSPIKDYRRLSTVKVKGLCRLVTFSTHLKGNIMDLVLTDVPDKIRSVTPVGRLGKSDHDIMIEIDNRRPKSKQQAATPIWSRANWASDMGKP